MCGVVERTKLLPVAEGLFVVVADDLVELACTPCIRADRPVTEAFVQPCSQLFRNPGVGRVPNQGVTKPVRVFPSGLCSEQVLPRECEQPRVDLLTLRVVGELEDSAADEFLARDCRAFQDGSFARREAVETGGK